MSFGAIGGRGPQGPKGFDGAVQLVDQAVMTVADLLSMYPAGVSYVGKYARVSDLYGGADEIRVRDGKTYAVITDDRPDGPLKRPHIPIGTEIEVPNYKLKHDRGNPTGHGVIFVTRSLYVYCFVQGTGI